MTTASTSDDLLAALKSDTESSLSRIQAREGQDLTSKIAELETQLEDAAKIKNEEERNLRMQVLQADFENLRAELAAEEQDLSQAVMGLNALMTEMGEEYADLQKLSPEEQKVIDDASAKVSEAERELRRVEDAPGWKFIFSSRDKALRQAREGIEAAKQGVADAESRVKGMARDRLMKADIEQSLQEFMYKVQKTIEIMDARATQIVQQLEAVSVRKAEAFRVKEEAAKVLEELDASLNEKEAEMRAAEEELEALANGSSEYVAKEKEISALRTTVEEIRGRRNEALVLFQSKERFASELDVHEKSQMKLRDNQRAWITLLKSDTEERLITFRSRLEAMKAMSDQDVAQNLDNLGTAIDKSNVDFMAKVGAASDKRRMEMVESQPDRIKRIEEARAAQAEAQARIRDREKEALEKFRERYGIDPMDSSFFTYTEEEEPAQA